MAPRASFKGFLRLSLVSVPVKGFTANNTSSEIRLNQLHSECHSRVKYQKICPTHGELATDDIVSGYEYAKGQYVVIDPAEVSKLRKTSEKAVDIIGFIHPDQIDPKYLSGRTYYFLPDGPAGKKPYQLLHTVMEEDGLVAIGSAILSGRQQMVLIRPFDELIGMSILSYAAKVRGTDELVEELAETEISDAEMELTRTLVAASTLTEFDYSEYKDDYTDQLEQIIQAKIDGQEIVAAPDPEEPKVINLMDALKASVENAAGAIASKSTKKSAAKKRKKSGAG
ncbi:MAG: Ku protein [Planctomycetes bacterium]|nr:Ku protein [Planctomycetota bacterium]